MRAGAHFLVIDLSNSFTKFADASKSKVGRVQRIATQKLRAKDIEERLQASGASIVVACSVVPGKEREIVRAARGRQLIWVTPKVRLDIAIDYPNPERIGADRLANAVAATHLYNTPAVVIDFGTAATFDVITAGDRYIGGVIAPGLEAMTTFLFDRTALLPKISLRQPRVVVGKSTRAAMLSGAVFGYRGLVRGILKAIVQEKFRGQRVDVIATGGYAGLIARGMREVAVVRENLTLEGLRLVGCMNAASWF